MNLRVFYINNNNKTVGLWMFKPGSGGPGQAAEQC